MICLNEGRTCYLSPVLSVETLLSACQIGKWIGTLLGTTKENLIGLYSLLSSSINSNVILLSFLSTDVCLAVEYLFSILEPAS